MTGKNVRVKTYLTISLVCAVLFLATLIIVGSPALNLIFGIGAISTLLMAIFQHFANKSKA